MTNDSADDAKPASVASTKPCKICAQEIPSAARKCTKCDSFQDWRGNLSVNTTILSLLIALISTTVAALPVLRSYAADDDSDIYVQVLGNSPQRIKMVAVNRGTKPGFIADGHVSSQGRPWASLQQFEGNTSTLIPPGQVLEVSFRPSVFLEEATPTGTCSGYIRVVNFRSNRSRATFELPCHAVSYAARP